ncbi:MAG: hypothetical protein HZA80_01770 [Candidatus Taylorbacteria bacterium]|nr:hypothetical protein [Candidatus Taylorbacteria bacterium]
MNTLERLVEYLYCLLNGIPQTVPVNGTVDNGVEILTPLNKVKKHPMNASWVCVIAGWITLFLHVWVPKAFITGLIYHKFPSTVNYGSVVETLGWIIGGLCLIAALKTYLFEAIFVATETGKARIVEGTFLSKINPKPFTYQDTGVAGEREYVGPGLKFKWFTNKVDDKKVANLDVVVLDLIFTDLVTKDNYVVGEITTRVTYRTLLGFGLLSRFTRATKEDREKLIRAKIELFLRREVGQYPYLQFMNLAFKEGFTSQLRAKMKQVFGGQDYLSELELQLAITTDNLEVIGFVLTKRQLAAFETQRIAGLIAEVTERFYRLCGLSDTQMPANLTPDQAARIAQQRLQVIVMVERMFADPKKRQDVIFSGGAGGVRGGGRIAV